MAVVVKNSDIPKAVISNDTLLSYSPEIVISYDPKRCSYAELWKTYGLTLSGGKLQEITGFDKSNYYKMRNGQRKMKPAVLMSVCMLCRLTPQQAHNLFHECCDTDELQCYGYPALVLSFLLKDIHDPNHPSSHTYKEFMRYSLKLQLDFELGMPYIFNQNRKWKDMYSMLEKRPIH